MSALILAGVVLTGAWTQLDEIGLAGWLALALMFVADRYTGGIRWGRLGFPGGAAPLPVLAAAGLCLLHLAHVALTAREEFGFGGDEGYHLSATRAIAVYFMRAGPFLALALAVYGVLRYRHARYAATAAMAVLLGASYLLPASPIFGRYPAGFYMLAAPLNVAFDVLQHPYPHTANHIVNVLSLPAWLFLLRPLIIGRWPDWRVLPVALLIYFQRPALAMIGGTLLEPWALVFLLLALEALVALDDERRWVAVPLCAIATFFKETAVLLLPTTWLLACVEWNGWRPSIRKGGLAVGAASIAPFLLYLAVRRGMAVTRGYEVAGIGATFALSRISEWVAMVRAQIGVGPMIAAVAATALAARFGALWIATALAIALFFFVDVASLPYTGYSRFLAYSLVSVCGAVFAWTYRSEERGRALVLTCAALALLQAGPALRTFALDLQPDHERNSLEWNGAMIRLPVRALASRIPALEGGEQVRRIRVVTFGTSLDSLRVAYPDLAARYELVRADDTRDCRCLDNAEAVLGAFEWPANLGDTDTNRAAFASASASCVRQIETTCVTRTTVDDRSGATVGIAGVGRLLLLALPQHDERPQR